MAWTVAVIDVQRVTETHRSCHVVRLTPSYGG